MQQTGDRIGVERLKLGACNSKWMQKSIKCVTLFDMLNIYIFIHLSLSGHRLRVLTQSALYVMVCQLSALRTCIIASVYAAASPNDATKKREITNLKRRIKKKKKNENNNKPSESIRNRKANMHIARVSQFDGNKEYKQRRKICRHFISLDSRSPPVSHPYSFNCIQLKRTHEISILRRCKLCRQLPCRHIHRVVYRRAISICCHTLHRMNANKFKHIERARDGRQTII